MLWEQAKTPVLCFQFRLFQNWKNGIGIQKFEFACCNVRWINGKHFWNFSISVVTVVTMVHFLFTTVTCWFVKVYFQEINGIAELTSTYMCTLNLRSGATSLRVSIMKNELAEKINSQLFDSSYDKSNSCGDAFFCTFYLHFRFCTILANRMMRYEVFHIS